jgi:hypothetical protein
MGGSYRQCECGARLSVGAGTPTPNINCRFRWPYANALGNRLCALHYRSAYERFSVGHFDRPEVSLRKPRSYGSHDNLYPVPILLDGRLPLINARGADSMDGRNRLERCSMFLHSHCLVRLFLLEPFHGIHA